MKNLQMSLKREWFEKTKSGEKTEDYREINEYWFKRLVFDYKRAFKYLTGYDWENLDSQSRERFIKAIMIDSFRKSMIAFKTFKENIMTLGYPKTTDTERILRLEHKGIEIRIGRVEWGAIHDKLYFVILHGSIID